MARRSSRVHQDDEEVELNMTPMLDVVFILLIFFIVTSVFIDEPGIDPERPDAITTEDAKPSMLIAVSDQNEIWIDGDVYDSSEVGLVIEQILQETPNAEAMIQGDTDANIGTILDVQEELQRLGVEEVNVSTLPRN
jgi:biopolymer transport protein ExbD